jgi:hypothetical protein
LRHAIRGLRDVIPNRGDVTPESLGASAPGSRASLGQAAKLAELSKRTFMEILGRFGVPVFNYSPEELRTEVDV